jgi:hypothetical protein
MVVIHQEANCIAGLLAAEAVVKLLAGADREGSGLFAVERATGPVFAAFLFLWYASVDDLDDIDAVEKIIDEVSWNPAGHPDYTGIRVSVATARTSPR